ncbi:MAG: hypothetical protein GY847_03255 [Proteobacteria bacterium]|nr:hypothetical protein [Pseudomonadota bacterium]
MGAGVAGEGDWGNRLGLHWSPLLRGPVAAGAVVSGAGGGVAVEPGYFAVHPFAFAQGDGAATFGAVGGGGGVGACGDGLSIMDGGLHWLVSPDRG